MPPTGDCALSVVVEVMTNCGISMASMLGLVSVHLFVATNHAL